MGQAKRRQQSWGRKVAHPATYVDIVHYRGIPPEFFFDPEGQVVGFALAGTGATLDATLPCPSFPQRNVHEWSPRLAPPLGEDDEALIIDFDDESEFILLDDETLELVDGSDFDDIRAILGQGFRFAAIGTDRRELAIDAETGLLIDMAGNHPDPTWFENRAIILPDNSVFSMRGSFAMRAAALFSPLFLAVYEDEDEENPHQNLGMIAKHILAHADSCRSLSSRHGPLAADIEAAQRIFDGPEILARETLPDGGAEMVLYGALHVVRDRYDEMADIYSVRHFCERTGYTLAAFRRRGHPDDKAVWDHFDRAARIIAQGEGEPVSVHPENAAWITFCMEIPGAAAMVEADLRPFIESGSLIGEVIYPGETHRAWRHDGMIAIVREVSNDFQVVLSDDAVDLRH